ncbi:MAG: selenide, water dikinase SelD [Spirochaetia bacterium]
MPMVRDPIRLTSLCSAGGCAAKMGPEALAQVLRPLAALFPAGSRPELLVGLEAGDDAAVYSLDDSRALVFTADFFTPVVDAPYDFGAVAAANALSDVYAMGGEPTIVLNIAGFPSTLPPDVIGEILRGGAEKAWEAGCVLVGGHTICSQEPIYGLAVIGFVDPHRMFVKTGVRAGDSLILTKPLGMGVITTALKRGIAPAAVLARAVTSMTSLNRDASRILALHGVAACTDVTGFSILGHGLELARKSAIGLRFHAARMPFMDGASAAGEAGAFPGGTKNNRAAYEASVRFSPEIAELTRKLLFSPETSGGLLAAVPGSEAGRCIAALKDAGIGAFAIGEADSALPAGTIDVK